MLPDYDLQFVSALSAAEPITVGEAKRQCRRVPTFTADDPWFAGEAGNDGAIAAARGKVEGDTGRQLRQNTTWDLKLRGFSCAGVVIPVVPLLTVVSVGYLDTAGVAQTLPTTDYLVVAPSGDRAGYGRIELAYGKSWPSTLGQTGAVTIRLTAGYASGSSQPQALRRAQLTLIAHWYKHREAVALGTISTEIALLYASLIDNYRLYPMPVLV